jgi:hypothetical protein
MAKLASTTKRKTSSPTRILGGPPRPPHRGVMSVSRKAIYKAARDLAREEAIADAARDAPAKG